MNDERNKPDRLPAAPERRRWRYEVAMNPQEYDRLRSYSAAAGIATPARHNIPVFIRETALGKTLRGKRDIDAIKELLRLRVYWESALVSFQKYSGRGRSETEELCRPVSELESNFDELEWLAQRVNLGKLPLAGSPGPGDFPPSVGKRRVQIRLGDRERIRVMSKAYQAGYQVEAKPLRDYLKATALSRPPQTVFDPSALEEIRRQVRGWAAMATQIEASPDGEAIPPEAAVERYRELRRMQRAWRDFSTARFGKLPPPAPPGARAASFPGADSSFVRGAAAG